MPLAEPLALLIGTASITWLLVSMVRTLVIPRPERVWLTTVSFESARRVVDRAASRLPDPVHRHRLRGAFAPTVLIALPLIWTVGLIISFAFVYVGLGHRPFWAAVELSGSSLTTLGFVAAPTTALRLVAILEALIGLAVVALMIGFLPTLYGTFSHREVAVGRLTTRAGEPPRPVDFIVRLRTIGRLGMIGELWADWEDWFAELGETHTTFPALIYFRSATPGRSWLSAAEAALDTAALVRSTELTANTGQADTMIRAGYLAVRAIADLYRIPPELDPADIGALSIDRAQFDVLVADLIAGGVAVDVDLDDAWAAFAGWRVNYDRAVVGLRALIGDVPSHWDA